MKKLLNKTKLVEEHCPGGSSSSSSSSLGGGLIKSSSLSLGSGGGGGGGVEQLPSSSNQTNSLIGKSIKLQLYTITIEEVIAEGGFGVVFLAKGVSHGGSNNSGGGGIKANKGYALKRIVVNNDGDLVVAEKEIQILSTLSKLGSPYILQLLDYQTTKLTSDIKEILSLTPYCKGSLLNVMNKGVAVKSPMRQEQVLRIFSDIVQGVGVMHSLSPAPIIHRDLKVENILENGGIFLICDFGSATNKVWDPDVHSVQSISEELEKYTTLAYRAPEMVDLYSGRGPITTKSDIWALGVLVYKMCYWTTPFGDSILAIQSAKKLDFPSTPAYGSELQLLINYMLLPDQTLRPDIYQVSELVHQLLEAPNPLQVANRTRPWSFQEITDYYNQKAAALELSSLSNAESMNKKVPVAVTVLETSVTPRQRPKATNPVQPPMPNVLVTPQIQPGLPESTVIAGQKVAVLMPPPKSPKLERKVIGMVGEVACFGDSQLPASSTTVLPGQPQSVTPVMQSALPFAPSSQSVVVGEEAKSSLPPTVASWNPFEDTFVAPSQPVGKESTDLDDDPFAKAPFGINHKSKSSKRRSSITRSTSNQQSATTNNDALVVVEPEVVVVEKLIELTDSSDF